jgi:hypothetical protein
MPAFQDSEPRLTGSGGDAACASPYGLGLRRRRRESRHRTIASRTASGSSCHLQNGQYGRGITSAPSRSPPPFADLKKLVSKSATVAGSSAGGR